MGEMPGQDQLRFEQREEEADDRRDTDYAEEAPHMARNDDQRDEGRHRGENTEGDRDVDVQGAFACGFELVFSSAFPAMDAFSDDDGIVDEDAEYQDEGHHGQGTDRDRESRKEHQGPEEGDGDSGGYPHGQAKTKKEGEYRDHQQKPAASVDEQGVQPHNEIRGLIVEQGNLDAFGNLRARLLEPNMELSGNFQGVLIADSLDQEEDGG